MIEFFQITGSASFAARIALEEAGAGYPAVNVHPRRRDEPASFGEVNPLERVPALREGAVEIYETGAVLLWLADRFPASALGPAVGDPKRGDLYRQRKEYDLSVADFDQVIKIDHEAAKGYVDRGWVYVLKNDLDKAEADFDKALELHQNDPSALVGRGVVKSRKGKPTDGSADLALARQLEPGIFDEIKKLGIE